MVYSHGNGETFCEFNNSLSFQPDLEDLQNIAHRVLLDPQDLQNIAHRVMLDPQDLQNIAFIVKLSISHWESSDQLSFVTNFYVICLEQWEEYVYYVR